MNRFTTRATVLALVLLLAAGGAVFGDGHMSTAIVIETGATFDITNLGNISYDPNLELTMSGDIGDYNSYKVTLQDLGGTNIASAAKASGDLAEDLVQINEAYFSTDLLGSLGVMGVPVAATLTIGYDAFNTAGYGLVTSKETEGEFSAEFEGPAVNLDIMIQDQIGIETALDMGLEAFYVGLTADIAPVQAEVVYSVDTGETATTADIGGGLEVALPLGGVDLAVGAEFNFDTDTANTMAFDWGAALKADLGVAALGAGASTNGTGELSDVTIEASAGLMDGVALEAYLGLAIAPSIPTTDTFDLLDIALLLGEEDPFKWWIGFALRGASGVIGDKHAPGDIAAGSSAIYVKAKLKV